MKLGIHAYAWCSQWSNDTLHLIDQVASLGLDFIEIPLMCLDTFDAAAVRERLQTAGIGAVTSTVLLEGTDITSDDPAVRASGVDYLTACVEATHAIGATSFSGVIFAQHTRTLSRRPEARHWQYSADSLRHVARRARELGVTIGIEPVNRYETFLINTCEQALELKDMIGTDNVRIHLDTYHMNIEEKGIAQGILDARDHLRYIHLSESDRGTPGTGTVAWDEIFAALRAVGFRGGLAMESFINMPPEIGYGLSVWRPVASGEAEVMENGLPFLRNKARQYGLI